MKILCTIIAAALLAGCATAYRLPTKSGLPEVETVASRAEMKAALFRLMVERGAQCIQESDSVVIFEAGASGAANFWFTNLVSGQKPMWRFKFNLLDESQMRRITATVSMTRQPGLGGTHEMQFDERKPREDLQRFLEKLKAELER